MTVRVLNTVRQHAERHPAFTEGAIRNIIFNARSNGFASAIVRRGRRVLIDEQEFFACIDRQNGREAGHA